MEQALLLGGQGPRTVYFDWKNETGRASWNQIRDWLDCEAVEATLLDADMVMWTDEEGIFKAPYYRDIRFGEAPFRIYGNILLTGRDGGKTTGLSEQQIAYILEHWRMSGERPNVLQGRK